MLGLGTGKSSLISQLNSQGLVRNVVGHCLSAQGGGYIFFGDVHDSSRLSWTPEITNIFLLMWSSNSYFNSNAYQALISWLQKELAGKAIKEAPHDLIGDRNVVTISILLDVVLDNKYYQL